MTNSPYPNSLNPCRFNGDHGDRPMRKASYGVHGRVTDLCCNCVFELEKKGLSRLEALATFTPDPEGNPVREENRDVPHDHLSQK